MRKALAIMVKAPRIGTVKTRLVPPLSHEEAAALYRCFLKDIRPKLSSISGVDIFAAYTPEGSDGELRPLMPAGVCFLQQEGACLGERMFNVFKELSLKGYGAVTIVGSDAPDLPTEYIEGAFKTLEDGGTDAVVGPAIDGGYYLVGLKNPVKALFEGMEWSTPAVMRRTIEKLEAYSLQYSLLPVWHDIDCPADLSYLKDNPGCPESAAYLSARGL